MSFLSYQQLYYFPGALYANNNGLEKAIDDFEAALKINPGHVNAKKYLCETLIAVGRNHEDDKNVRENLKDLAKSFKSKH